MSGHPIPNHESGNEIRFDRGFRVQSRQTPLWETTHPANNRFESLRIGSEPTPHPEGGFPPALGRPAPDEPPDLLALALPRLGAE